MCNLHSVSSLCGSDLLPCHQSLGGTGKRDPQRWDSLGIVHQTTQDTEQTLLAPPHTSALISPQFQESLSKTSCFFCVCVCLPADSCFPAGVFPCWNVQEAVGDQRIRGREVKPEDKRSGCDNYLILSWLVPGVGNLSLVPGDTIPLPNSFWMCPWQGGS